MQTTKAIRPIFHHGQPSGLPYLGNPVTGGSNKSPRPKGGGARSIKRITGGHGPEVSAARKLVEFKWLSLAEESHYNCNLLAKTFGQSLRQLERDLPKFVGDSPQNWLDQLRMVQARALLQAGVPIKEVSHALHFSDVSAFYRHFKRTYGITPKQFMVTFVHRCEEILRLRK